jgi:ubiquinone/menaquinone biosynthesis C-methylase UbiE
MPTKTLVGTARPSRRLFDRFKDWTDRVRGFDETIPHYLRWYWWAYTSPWAIRFWDVRIFGSYPLINAVLFGNYGELTGKTIDLCKSSEQERKTLHLSSLYGGMVAWLARITKDYTLIDIVPRQLDRARQKIDEVGATATLRQMNAEHLEYNDDSYDQTIIFFLLHEVTPQARENILSEAIRVTRPGGRLCITEYNELGSRHFLHRIPLFIWFSGIIEPCLPGFWRENLLEKLEAAATTVGKSVTLNRAADVWNGFYRVREFAIALDTKHTIRDSRHARP